MLVLIVEVTTGGTLTLQGFAAQEAARVLAWLIVELINTPTRDVFEKLASFATLEPSVEAIVKSKDIGHGQ